MLASGGDDGTLRIWDLRNFSQGSYVSNFSFHKSPITSVEWCPYEGSMLATSAGDDQVGVSCQCWTLALCLSGDRDLAVDCWQIVSSCIYHINMRSGQQALLLLMLPVPPPIALPLTLAVT